MLKCFEIKHGSLEYKATVALRDEILRKPLGLQFSEAELQSEADSHHLVCYESERLVGCLVLKPESDGNFKMRQVAVAADYQGCGIGRRLVEYSEQFARTQGATEMIMNARETAVPFYERLGYQREGERFTEVSIPHFVLRKALISGGK